MGTFYTMLTFLVIIIAVVLLIFGIVHALKYKKANPKQGKDDDGPEPVNAQPQPVEPAPVEQAEQPPLGPPGQ